VTHAQVLEQAGANIQQTVEQATAAINDADIGWAYIDQAQSSPKVFALQDLRTRMIKRPSLATLEKLLIPVKAKSKTHLAIGFVYKAYPPVLSDLAIKAGYNSALIIRGLEGGIIPTLREASTNFRMFEGELTELCLDPTDFAINMDTRGVSPEQDSVTAKETLVQGMAALSGEQGAAFESLVYGAAMNIWHAGLQQDYASAADYVREVMLTGKAKAHFEKGVA
jgi:anthranilate phosphoribosyltransferase